jgi:transposase
MAAPVSLRSDFDAVQLRGLAKRSRHPDQIRRLLALAQIYDGGGRGDAARIGNVSLQTIRDWALRFNAEGPAGLIAGKAPGPQPKLSAQQRQKLEQMVEQGPIPAAHGVVRWRLIDLAQWIWEEFRISSSKQTLSRELRAMGFPQALGPPAPLRPEWSRHGGV